MRVQNLIEAHDFPHRFFFLSFFFFFLNLDNDICMEMMSVFERVEVEAVGKTWHAGATAKSHQTSVITRDGEMRVLLDSASLGTHVMYVLCTPPVSKFPG